MSGKLVAEVLDRAPRGLNPRALAVLAAIAEKANDETREAWPSQELLAHRAQCTVRHVRNLTGDLVRRGLLSQPGRSGRPGHRGVYRIPSLPEVSVSTNTLPPACRDCGEPAVRRGTRGPWPVRCPECRAQTGTLEFRFGPAQSGTRVSGQSGTRVSAKAELQEFPPSLRTLIDPSVDARVREDAAGVIRRKCPDADDDEIRELLDQYDARKPERLAAYATTLARNGDLARDLGELRSARDAAASAARLAEAREGPECEHGVPGGKAPHPETGMPICPLCRRAEASGWPLASKEASR